MCGELKIKQTTEPMLKLNYVLHLEKIVGQIFHGIENQTDNRTYAKA